MRIFLRLKFQCASDRYADLMVDVLLDEGSRHWVSSVPTAGWWGQIDTEEVWPFVLQSAGRLDFGSDHTAPPTAKERFGWIDLEDRIIAEGESFTLEYGEESWQLKLAHLSDITAL